MNMLHPNAKTVQPADLFDYMEHLNAQQDSPPTARTAKPRGPLYRQGDTIGPVTLSGALR